MAVVLSIWDRLRRPWTFGATPAVEAAGDLARPPRDWYALLRALYRSNGLYDDVTRALAATGVDPERLKPLRNPAHRIVEFYTGKLWPGTLPDALPLETDNEALRDPIATLWAWSNWGTQKQVFVRWLAIYGDVFAKVVLRPERDRVYFQLLDPHYVSDFDTDERGFLTYVRIDVPQAEREGDAIAWSTHTEVWSKDLQTYRRWRHTRPLDEPLERLGAPDEETPLAAYGIDFVPVVHAKFRDMGEVRGDSAYGHAIDKIDEANRQATRLHHMLFRSNRTTWVLEGEGMRAGDTRPMPPPRIPGLTEPVPPGTPGAPNDADVVRVGDDVIYPLPGGWRLRSNVPELNYADALAILNAHLLELEKDCPELAYSRIRDIGREISGRAVRLMLGDAIDACLEARGNAEDALIRLDQMGLTIGAAAGLFRDLGGTYETGAFAHRFEARDVLAPDALEVAQVEQLQTGTAVAKLQLGYSVPALQRELGLTDAEIEDMEAEREADTADAADALLTALDRGTPPARGYGGAFEAATRANGAAPPAGTSGMNGPGAPSGGRPASPPRR